MSDLTLELIKTAQKLKDRGLVSEGVNKGSISLRLAEDRFLISPSKLDYAELTPENVNIMKLDGSFVVQPSPVSRDSYFHLAIYQNYPHVQAIIHTHSKYATALCLANRPLPFITMGMKFHCGGALEIAPYAPPNSEECTRLILAHLKDKKAVLLQNHGLVCVGESMTACYETAEFIESLSESYLHALLLGEVKEIDGGRGGY
ncbi:MAG: class II aldolase/adducin family protein [Firmicutes bacterium]|nr:class II aldolase/adducin family protein [Bacillota bacterium]